MIKLMENFKINYDQTVRDASGNIVQFNYGDDGFDAVHIVRLTIPEVLEPFSRWELEYDDEMAVVREIDMIGKAVHFFEWWKQDTGEELVSCPVDVEALFERAKILSVGSKNTLSLNTIWNRCWMLICSVQNELFRNYLVMFLQIRRMTDLSEVFFDWFLNTIGEKYNRAMVEPGEMVGVLAGQSIAE